MKIIKHVNSLRRAFYRERLVKFKRFGLVMFVVGALFALFYCGKVVYSEYASARVHIVLTYPEIASSCYPDGERFTIYDLIDDQKIEAALKLMQEDGKYQSYTVEDIKDKLFLYSYLKNSAGSSVSSARSEGNDYSYVANEYRITYIQMHDYRNNSLLKRLFSPDYSSDFLEALVEVNRDRIAEFSGGIGGFKALVAMDDLSGYDYKEMVQQYRVRVNATINYLNELENKSPGFVSVGEDTALKDIIGDYELLVTNKLDGIASFIESSAISRDAEINLNKLFVNLENNSLQFSKYSDRALVNKYAMDNYDHTFTENLINVVRDETQGLYQARPKTAFDTIVEQKHDADEMTAEYGAEIELLNQEISHYGSVAQSGEEYERLCARCEEYLDELKTEYEDLADRAISVVEEYYNKTNENYITADVTEREVFSTDLIVGAGGAFLLGAVVMFIICIAISVIQDRVMLRRKKKLLASIQQTKVGGI